MNTKVALLKLQEIDTMYDKVRRRLLSLQKATEGSEELTAAQAELEAVEQELHDAQAEQQDTELESRSLTEKIRETEQLLMSGEVRNPKELEALQASVESMKSHRSVLEDRSVERLVQVENLNASLEQLRASLEEIEQRWHERQEAFSTEIEQRKKEYVYLKKAREQVAAMLPAEMLEQYEHLRRRKNGIAVARLEDEMCGACHTQVASGILSSIRYSEELFSCPSCGRILLADE